MSRQRFLQPTLPRVAMEPDGQTHRRDCECPRCEAGFRPSENERQAAARRWQEKQEREAAAEALARQRTRQRLKALRLELRLDEQARRTEARLREQAALVARLRTDPRLEALLASRRAGRPVEEALAEAERLR